MSRPHSLHAAVPAIGARIGFRAIRLAGAGPGVLGRGRACAASSAAGAGSGGSGSGGEGGEGSDPRYAPGRRPRPFSLAPPAASRALWRAAARARSSGSAMRLW